MFGFKANKLKGRIREGIRWNLASSWPNISHFEECFLLRIPLFCSRRLAPWTRRMTETPRPSRQPWPWPQLPMLVAACLWCFWLFWVDANGSGVWFAKQRGIVEVWCLCKDKFCAKLISSQNKMLASPPWCDDVHGDVNLCVYKMKQS
jgi:hypothetical protein